MSRLNAISYAHRPMAWRLLTLSRMAIEVELKFELAPAAVRRLEASRWFRALEGSAKREELVSVYFDTRKRKLRDEGISLRVRHTGGKRLQTIKADAGMPLARKEWEKEIES